MSTSESSLWSLDTPVDRLPLGVRVKAACKQSNDMGLRPIHTLRDLIAADDLQLWGRENFGFTSYRKIKDFIAGLPVVTLTASVCTCGDCAP